MSNPAFELIGLEALRLDPQFLQIDGNHPTSDQRLTVVVLDTGIDATHDLLSDNFLGYVDFVNDEYDSSGQRIFHTEVQNTEDPEGHGTHVAGIIGASDPDVGVAPGVDIISLKVLGTGQNGAELQEALQWVLDNRSEYNIVAVNMSLAVSSAFYTQPPEGQGDPIYSIWQGLIDSLEQADVTVVSAAGNDYAANHINSNLRQNISIPAIASTLAVGAVWEDGTVTNARWSGSQDITTGADRLVSFSQRLSTYSGMVFAPGAVIESTLPGPNDQIGGLSGTSMASPMVAGAVALMQDAALTFSALSTHSSGQRLLNPSEVESILLQTSVDIFDGDLDTEFVLDNEHTDVTASNAGYKRIDVYAAVQAVADLFDVVDPSSGDGQLFYFRYNYTNDTTDFYTGYGYTSETAAYTVGATEAVEGGTYTITGVSNGIDVSETLDQIVVTGYYDGSTGYGYADSVLAEGTAGLLGGLSGNAYGGDNFDTTFSTNDKADLVDPNRPQAELVYFTYTYGEPEIPPTNPPVNEVVIDFVNIGADNLEVPGGVDFYTGYFYAPVGTIIANPDGSYRSALDADGNPLVQLTGYTNQTGNQGSYIIGGVSNVSAADQIGLVTVLGYYDAETESYASFLNGGYGYEGLNSESGEVYDFFYNTPFEDAQFSTFFEADLVYREDPQTEEIQSYDFTYRYGNGDYYSGYGYADPSTPYAEGQTYYVNIEGELVAYTGTIPPEASLNEIQEQGYYTIGGVNTLPVDNASNYVNTVYVNTYFDGGDGNGEEQPGGGYGFAYDAWGDGYGGLGSEQGYAYDSNYASTDVYFSKFDEANLVSQTADNQLYYFQYFYNNGDYYEGYGYAAADTYAEEQKYYLNNQGELVLLPEGITTPPTDGQLNEAGLVGTYVINAVQASSDSYYNDQVYVFTYYDGGDGNGEAPGGEYGFAYDIYGDGYGGLGSESGYAYDNNYQSTDIYFSSFDEANLVEDFNGNKQLYYFTYDYGNGDTYEGYGYAAANTYAEAQTYYVNSANELVPYTGGIPPEAASNETGEKGYYLINAVYEDRSTAGLGSVYVNYYNDADTGYGSIYDIYGEGYGGLGSESGYAYDTGFNSDFFSNFSEVDFNPTPEPTPLDLYYFKYEYGNGDFYTGYGYATADEYSVNEEIRPISNNTEQEGVYTIETVYPGYSGIAGEVYVGSYYDSGYGFASFASGYGSEGLQSESGFAYDQLYNEQSFDEQNEINFADTSLNLYYFKFEYGNGDFYSGYGYTSEDYTVEQEISDPKGASETNAIGTYTILSVDPVSYGYDGDVYVYSYYDGDANPAYGYAYDASGYGYEGLGSEAGYAYDANYLSLDPAFGWHQNYETGIFQKLEADLIATPGVDTNGTLYQATNLVDAIPENLGTVTGSSNRYIGSDDTPDSGGPVPTDVDLYRFELAASGLLSLETAPTESGEQLDSILRLFDVYGNEIVYDDDSGVDLYSSLNASLEAGTYYVGVSGYSNFYYQPDLINSGVEGSTGNYDLKFAFDASDVVIDDRNGTFAALDVSPLFDRSATFNRERNGAGFDLAVNIGTDPLYPGWIAAEDQFNVGATDVDLVMFTPTASGLAVFETNGRVKVPTAPEGGYVYPNPQDTSNPNPVLRTLTQSNLNTIWENLFDGNGDDLYDVPVDTVLRLFDSNRTVLAEDDDGGADLFSRLEFNLIADETYYLGISGYGNSAYNPTVAIDDPNSGRVAGATGSALLSVVFQPATGPVDPDGVLLGANNLSLTYGNTTDINGTIGSDTVADQLIYVTIGDVDMYKFTADVNGVLLIDVDTVAGADPALDSYVRVFSIDGTQVASNDDALDQDFNQITTETGESKDSFLRLNVQQGDTYYIAVAAAGNGGNSYNPSDLTDRTNQTTGSYQLSLSYGGGVIDEDGYIHQELPSYDLTTTDTTTGNRASIPLKEIGKDGTTTIGGSDLDFVKVNFTGTTNRILTAATRSGTGFDPVLYIYDSAGTQLVLNDNASSSGTDSLLEIGLLPNEDYYVAVAGAGNEGFNPFIPGSGRNANSTGTYNLDLSLSPLPTNPDPFLNEVLIDFANAANGKGTLQGASADFDLALFGLGTATSYPITANATNATIILASLGEDIDDPNSGNREKNAFGRLYLTKVAGLTSGQAATRVASSSDVGADDVDIYPFTVAADGSYSFQTRGTGNAIDDASPVLKLYNADGTAVTPSEVTDFGVQGLVTGNILANLSADTTYYLAVLPTGSAGASFTMDTDSTAEGLQPGFSSALNDAQRTEFYQNTGNYSLSMASASLAASVSALDGSSVSRVFSLPLEVADLQLYGASGVTPSVSVTRSGGSAVAGSLVFDEDINELRFVPTNPLLAAGNYTITYDSEDFNVSGTEVGMTFAEDEETFTVSGTNPVVYLPSFARGPGQAVDIDGTGLPILIDKAQGITQIRLILDYDPDSLNVTNVRGLPEGWNLITDPLIQNGRVVVDIQGPALPTSDEPTELVRLIADVPASAVFNSAEVLEVTAGARAGSRTVDIADSTAVQKVAYLGDLSGLNGVINDADILAAAIKFSNSSITGFSDYDLTDPNLFGDFDDDGIINDADILALALRFAAGADALIPDPTPVTVSSSQVFIDPTIDIPELGLSNVGDTVTVPLNLLLTEDSINSFGLSVTYDTSALKVARTTSGIPRVTLNTVLTATDPNTDESRGWTIAGGVINVEETGSVGRITFAANSVTSPILVAEASEQAPFKLADVRFVVQSGATAGLTSINFENPTFSKAVLDTSGAPTGAVQALTPVTATGGSVTIAGTGGNTAPTITDVVNQPINQDTSTSALPFTIGDAETPVVALTVAGTSNNPTLVANSNIVIGGAGADRTVTVTPVAGQTGTATITLTVTDSDGATDTDTFDVTVNPVAVVPTVTIAATDANAAEAGVDPGQFTITLSEAAAEDITVTYTVGGNSTATPTSDYAVLSETETIAAGETTKTIAVIPVDDATDEGNESVILTLIDGATYDLGVTTTATVTIADNDVAAASPVDIDGNGTVTNAEVFLINQYLLLEGNGNRNSILESTFDLFGIQGATNTTGAALSAAIEPQLSLFDIDDDGTTSGSDVFLINQYLLLEGNSNRNSILEQTASIFGNDLNGPINTGAELSAALSSLVG